VSGTLVDEIAATAWSVVIAVGPLAVLFLFFQLFLLKLPREQVAEILTGTMLAAAGLFLFLLGIGIGFLPFGRIIGADLAALHQPWLFAIAGLLVGFLTTLGEPAVRVLADQVEDASNGSIHKSLVLYTICIGVALAVGLGVIRINYAIPVLYLLAPGYVLVIGLMWLSDKDFVGIAVDASGVATGPLANSFLLAFALGASAAMENQDPIVHGFGLVALIALAPIVTLVMLGVLVRLRTRKEG
jgi:Protein of unknown function (DUF1538)